MKPFIFSGDATLPNRMTFTRRRFRPIYNNGP